VDSQEKLPVIFEKYLTHLGELDPDVVIRQCWKFKLSRKELAHYEEEFGKLTGNSSNNNSDIRGRRRCSRKSLRRRAGDVEDAA
jgi:hypothetical protein